MARREITLREHLESIAAKGGRARAEKLSAAKKKAIAKKGGKVGGRARAQKLTAAERRAIGQKAAQARWKKPKRAKRKSQE